MKGFGQRMNCTSSRQASALSCAWSRWMKSSMRRDSNTTMRVQNFGAFFSSGPLSGNVLFSWRTAGYPSLYACLSPHVFCPEPIAHLLASPRSKASKLPSHGGYTLGIDAASSQCMQGCIPTLWHRFAWECLEKTLRYCVVSMILRQRPSTGFSFPEAAERAKGGSSPNVWAASHLQEITLQHWIR